MRIWLALALVGCSFPEKHFVGDIDARNDTTGGDMMIDGIGDPRYACHNQPLPTPPAMVTVSGTVIDLATGGGVGNAPVNGNHVVTGANIFSVNTNAAGQFSQDIMTGGTPVNIRVRISPTSTLPTIVWPPHPLVASITNFPFRVAPAAVFGTLANGAGTSYMSGEPVVSVVVFDCNNTLMGGATIVASSGVVRYLDNTGAPRNGLSGTDSSNGGAMIFAANTGMFTVTATSSDGFVYTPKTISINGNEWTQFGVKP